MQWVSSDFTVQGDKGEGVVEEEVECLPGLFWVCFYPVSLYNDYEDVSKAPNPNPINFQLSLCCGLVEVSSVDGSQRCAYD